MPLSSVDWYASKDAECIMLALALIMLATSKNKSYSILNHQHGCCQHQPKCCCMSIPTL